MAETPAWLTRLPEKLASKIRQADAQAECGGFCYEWQGQRKYDGYGTVTGEDGVMTVAHRAVWQIAVGPIPSGLLLCHQCNNPPCVNPEHIRLGTHRENMRERSRRASTDPWERVKRSSTLMLRLSREDLVNLTKLVEWPGAPREVGTRAHAIVRNILSDGLRSAVARTNH